MLLRNGIRYLAQASAKIQKSPLSLPEQPFDSYLLKKSFLFKRSRTLFKKQGGQFIATLVTSPRSLSSAILLRSEN